MASAPPPPPEASPPPVRPPVAVDAVHIHGPSSTAALPAPPVNPFTNETVRLSAWEIFKLCTLGITLAPLRGLLLGVTIIITWGCAKVALRGMSTKDLLEKPLPPERRRFLRPIPYLSRFILFLMGYMWISEHGQRDPRARLIVSNHIAFIETLYYGWRAFPSFVAKSDVMKYPIVGTIGKAMQLVFVDRESADSRKATAASIQQRAADPSWPPLLIFPEGTCVNGKALISYRLGAFSPGAPIQPVCLRFPFISFDPCWTVDVANFPLHIWRMLSQFVNFMEIRWLPVREASEAEKQHPTLFAAHVRQEMARALNIPCTDHSYDDVFFQVRAMKQRLGPEVSGTLEMANLKRLYDFKPESIQNLLSLYAKSSSFETGRMRYPEFCKALGFPPNPHTRAVFQLLDVDEAGEIDFRTYLGGMALLAKEEFNPAELERVIKFAFSRFDLKHVGSVDEEEFKAILAKPFPQMEPEEVHRLFVKGDTNKDGRLDYAEFANFMTSNPGYLKMFRIYAASQHYTIPAADAPAAAAAAPESAAPPADAAEKKVQ